MARVPGLHAMWMVGAWLLLGWALAGAPVAAAELAAADKVASVAVEGNHFVETGAILDKISVRAGQPFDRKRISRDVRRLFATGFFSDIRVTGVARADGRHLTFHVRENPMIASVKLDGLDAVKEKDVKLKLHLKPGRIYNKPDLDHDLRILRKGYLKKGYYQMRVEPVLKKRADGRVDVTLKVREGEITRIKRIRFIGNRVASDDELAGAIASQATGLMAWFRDRDVFNRDRLQADKQMLLQYYLNRGYLDAKVDSTLVSLSPDKRWFFVTFSIHEGPQYRVKSIRLRGDVVPDKETLMKLVKLEPGNVFVLKDMQGSIQDITTRVGDEGYAFATVTPLLHRNIEERTVDVTFDIEKGAQVYVERIEISGNDKTVDEVIRREMRQDEGARFSSSALETSKKRLKKLSLFKDVRVSMPKGSTPDKVKMKVKVEENRTGSLRFGVGFSQIQKVFIRSSISERNLFGRGYAGNLSGEIGARTQNFDASITDPYFLGENMSASLNAFKRQTRLQSLTSYKENSYGGGVGFGIPLTEELSYHIGYQYTSNNLFDIPANASPLLRSQAGKQTTGELTQSLTWDSRDTFIAPTEGGLLSASIGVAGLGGSNRFYTGRLYGGMFFPLGEGFTLNPSFEAQYIRGFGGRTVPIYRRFSLGGIGSVRGFDTFGITIRDPATNDVIGGNKTARASLNLFFPLPYIRTSGFRGVAFADAGTVADFNQKLSARTLRVSYGVGIEWLSPIGPISLSWGFPIRKQPGDVLRRFEFALGSTF